MWKCLFGRNQSLVSSLNMCLLQGCTALRGDQRLGAACSGSICRQPTNSLTSSVTEATFERGESLFWLCYPGITRNFNPIIASHSSSMGDGGGETRAHGLRPWLLTAPLESVASQPLHGRQGSGQPAGRQAGPSAERPGCLRLRVNCEEAQQLPSWETSSSTADAMP